MGTAVSGQLSKAAAEGSVPLPVAWKCVSKGCGDDVRRLDVGKRLGLGGWVLMCVVMVLVWAAVITSIVLAIRYLVGSGGASGGSPRYVPPRPEDVLAGRFAHGEIDEDEYRLRITLLHEHR